MSIIIEKTPAVPTTQKRKTNHKDIFVEALKASQDMGVSVELVLQTMMIEKMSFIAGQMFYASRALSDIADKYCGPEVAGEE